jgi:hypothetical protein
VISNDTGHLYSKAQTDSLYTLVIQVNLRLQRVITKNNAKNFYVYLCYYDKEMEAKLEASKDKQKV